ncbi:MAG: peptidylprolyl isomerase [Candidatus Baltobacteraceae bacterium]
MLKGIAGSVILASAYVLALGSIVHFEQERSLGAGGLAAALRSHDVHVVQRAELAIGRTKQPAGVPLLLARSHDNSTGVRALAIYGLGLVGTPSCAPAVVGALRDGQAVVRIAALDAAARLETAHGFGAAEPAAARETAALLRAGSATVRARAATALEAFSTGSQAAFAASRLTQAYARERDADVRGHIAWTLFRGYAKRAPLAALKTELTDPDEIVRIEAARALGKRGARSGIPLLAPLTRDASWRVQEQALESLKVLRGGKPAEHLKAIAPGIHLPPRVRDPFAGVKALARAPHRGKYGPPQAEKIIPVPAFSVRSAAQFTGPQPGPHPRMRIVTTQGNIYIELYPEWAPLTVENFMNLASGGYYDNNPWFRIVPDFVVQSGDPSANAPGVGYTTVAEENPIEQSSYIIAMGLDYTNPPNAHAKRDSAGSEFYITLSPQFHLNRDFSVFGRMIGGFDVLPRLVESDKILRIERLPDASS